MLRLAQSIGRIGVFERNMKTGDVFVSAEARVMFGLERRDSTVKAGDWIGSFVEEDRPGLLQSISEALQRRDEELAVECRIRRPDGAVGHLEMRARYFYDEARTAAALGRGRHRRDRTQAGRAAAGACRAPRCADGPAQPRCCCANGWRRRAAARRGGRGVRGALPRSGPLQGRQRHARPPDRRSTAGRGRPAAAGRNGSGRHAGEAGGR